MIIPSFNFITPKAFGSSTCFTQIAPSELESKVKSALKSVSAKATTHGPFNADLAH